MAIIYNSNVIRMDERRIRTGGAEIVCATGKLTGMSKKKVAFSVYLQPKLKANGHRIATEALDEAIGKARNDFDDPIIIVGGDINRFDLTPAIQNYPEIQIIEDLPTRDGVPFDVVFTNFADKIVKAKTRTPLTTEDGRSSDHRMIYVSANLENHHCFGITRYKTRPQTKKGDEDFARWTGPQC